MAAMPAPISYSSLTGELMVVTGSVEVAGAAAVAPEAASGTHASMSRGLPTRSSRHRGTTRMPVCITCSVPASTTCTIAVSAPSGRISANANGWSRGCFGRGSEIHVHVVTTPAGPTSTKSASDSPASSPVTGSYSAGGIITRPSASRTANRRPSRSPVRYRPMTGPTERV